MASTVSASGVEAIEKTIEVEAIPQISDRPIEEIYDVEATVQELVKGDWKRVCCNSRKDLDLLLRLSLSIERYAYNSPTNCFMTAYRSSKLSVHDWRTL